MFRRNLVFGFFAFGAFVVSTACGGNVKQGTDSPSEQLRTGGADRCKAACATVVTCGLDSSSCDCSSCACPPDVADCTCAPCTCTSPTTSSCESECAKSVQELVDEEPECDASMLALLDCLAGATCSKGEVPCNAEERAFKDCGHGHDVSTAPPAMGDTDPGSAGPTGSVLCASSAASVFATGDGGLPLPSGEPSCGIRFEQCSDGASYKVECRTTPGVDLECTCLVDGVAGATFNARTCNQTQIDLNVFCGWNLR